MRPARSAVKRALSLVMLAVLAGAVLRGSRRDPLPDPDTTITLKEYVVGAPATLPAGENVFLVRNQGHAHHNLTVCPLDEETGQCAGAPRRFDMLRRPRNARDAGFYPDRSDMLVLGKRWNALIRYDLTPGTYRFYCGVIGHAQNGMQRTVTVR